jgi:luciferase family oxidoreductase group 1
MLPNHAPLMVAERFRTLEALFPGRIDLGLGRAPGTDGVTAVALRRRQERREGDDFLERLHELVLWETGNWPANHPFRNVVAMPSDVHLPPLYLLGSSDYSAELAGRIGMGFAFAHHFATYDAVAAMRAYRERFQPAGWREAPHAILAIAAVCAETESEAERLASSMDLNWLRRAQGEYHPLPSPEEAAAYPYTEPHRARMRKTRERLFVGTPEMIERQLMPLVGASQADEVMITSAIYDHAARKRSYELIAHHFLAAAKATSAQGSD